MIVNFFIMALQIVFGLFLLNTLIDFLFDIDLACCIKVWAMSHFGKNGKKDDDGE